MSKLRNKLWSHHLHLLPYTYIFQFQQQMSASGRKTGVFAWTNVRNDSVISSSSSIDSLLFSQKGKDWSCLPPSMRPELGISCMLCRVSCSFCVIFAIIPHNTFCAARRLVEGFHRKIYLKVNFSSPIRLTSEFCCFYKCYLHNEGSITFT